MASTSALSDESPIAPAAHQSIFSAALVLEWTTAASSTTGFPLAELAMRLNQIRVADLCSQPPEIQRTAAELCSKLAEKWRQDTACCASRLSIIMVTTSFCKFSFNVQHFSQRFVLIAISNSSFVALQRLIQSVFSSS
jgi:hypothetical protein